MQQQHLFDKYQEGRHWENHPTAYAVSYADFLRQHRFNTLLVDIGSGNGRDVAVFRDAGLYAMGIDSSLQEIIHARNLHPECRFEEGDVEHLPFSSTSVGAYFMINVIHYVHKQKAMEELYRTLCPEGYLFIHFNVDIIAEDGSVDYHHDEGNIVDLVSRFSIVQKRKFKRVDTTPKIHTHTILEFILQK